MNNKAILTSVLGFAFLCVAVSSLITCVRLLNTVETAIPHYTEKALAEAKAELQASGEFPSIAIGQKALAYDGTIKTRMRIPTDQTNLSVYIGGSRILLHRCSTNCTASVWIEPE